MNEAAAAPVGRRQLDLRADNIATEIRRDYLHDYYVLIAPKRQARPFDLAGQNKGLVETDASPRLDLQPAIYEVKDQSGDWLTRVVENKYPALTLDNPKAYGKQELVIDTPERNLSFGELSVEQIEAVLLTYRQRTIALQDLSGITYVSVFRNDGHEAGASLAHAHSQIVALPFVPPHLIQESHTIERYAADKQTDPFDDIIQLEQQTKSRLIFDTEQWLCFAPYAPAWQMEVWWLPKRAIHHLAETTSQELTDLSHSLKAITAQLSDLGASYNLAIESGVSRHQRLHIKIRGRNILSPRGGLEVSTGLIINAIAPESAADWYRRGL